MRKFANLLVAGILPVLIVILFMKFVSLNLSYSLLIMVGSLFCTSFWQKNNSSQIILKIFLISVPLIVSFYLLIVTELPGMWISIPIFLIAVILGLYFSKIKFNYLACIGLFVGTGLIAMFLVPQIISKDLSNEVNEIAPNFELNGLTTSPILKKSDFSNKVLVLDFFGTWCAPCIAEMNELKKVKSHFSDYEDDLIFIVACTDTGGDSPEKAKKFHSNRKLPFEL